MKKKLLALLLSVMMVAALVPTMLLPTAAIDYYNGYVTAKVNEGAIAVDGSAIPDAAYLNSEKIVSTLHYDNINSSGETSSFYGYTAADEMGLYLWVKITDQSLDKGNGYEETILDDETGEEIIETKYLDARQGDRLELYIRASGAQSSASRAVGLFSFDYLNQIQAICPKYPASYTNVNGEMIGFNADLVDFKTTVLESEDAWVAELYLPWEALGGDFVNFTIDDFTGFQIGFQANNAATATTVTHKAYSYDTKHGGSYWLGVANPNNSFSSGNSYQGSHCVPLSFAGFDTAVVADAPEVDGRLDAAYLKSEKIEAYIAGGGVQNFTAYTAATTEGFYVYADIIDDTLDKATTTSIDYGDNFRFYFQMGNRFSERDWGYIQIDYRTPEECDAETTNAVPYRFLVKGAFADNTQKLFEDKIRYATTKKADGSGWTAELFIPWMGRMADNNFDELIGTTMAFTIQVNNYTNDNKQITYCLSDAFGGSAWVSPAGSSLSGNFYMAPVRFIFDEDSPYEIKRWAKYTTDEIVLDGVMDEAYSEDAVDLVDNVYVSTSVALENVTSGWHYGDFVIAKAYYTFTDTDMYVLVDVEDDTVATAKSDEYVCVVFENSDSIAKFCLSPFNGGEYITNSTYQGETVAFPASQSAYEENDMIALKLKGTADSYTGYTVEFKLPLTETEREALAKGEAVNIGIIVQANDSFVKEDGTCARRWYGFNVPYGNLFWQADNKLLGHTAAPKVRLDKNLTADDLNNDKNKCLHTNYTNSICDQCGHVKSSAEVGFCGDDLMWVLDLDTHTLTLLGTGNMYDHYWHDGVDYVWNLLDCFEEAIECGFMVPAPWWEYGELIETVDIRSGVIGISHAAFFGCHNIESIYIPTSLTYIGQHINDDYPITNVYYEGSETEWRAINSYTNLNYTNLKLNNIICNHKWDDGKITVAPTHLTEGIITYTCACGATKTGVVDKLPEHEWDDGVITTQPTQTSEGVKTYTCPCGATKTEKIPPIGESPKVVITSTEALVGETVRLTVSIENNPGIWGLAFELPIDTDVFEYVGDDASGTIFGELGVCGYDPYTSAYRFNGFNSSLSSNITADGKVVEIILKVKDDAPVGEYDVIPAVIAKDTIDSNYNRISFAAVGGTVTVIDYVLGDVNGDGDVTNSDVLLILRYIFSAEMYPLEEVVADVDRDGEISNADVLRIFRYIYDPELYPIG